MKPPCAGAVLWREVHVRTTEEGEGPEQTDHTRVVMGRLKGAEGDPGEEGASQEDASDSTPGEERIGSPFLRPSVTSEGQMLRCKSKHCKALEETVVGYVRGLD